METDSELSSHHVVCELLSGLGLISVLLVSLTPKRETFYIIVRNFLLQVDFIENQQLNKFNHFMNLLDNHIENLLHILWTFL